MKSLLLIIISVIVIAYAITNNYHVKAMKFLDTFKEPAGFITEQVDKTKDSISNRIK